MGAVVEQVGGTHYPGAGAYGHWDLMEDHDIAYLEANATKYVFRWRLKGGVEDLRKAVSYLRKMAGRPVRRRIPSQRLVQWMWVTGVKREDAIILSLVLDQYLGGTNDIERAVILLEDMIQRQEDREAA